MNRIIFHVAMLLLLVQCSTKVKVDLIVYNGSIYAVDSQFKTFTGMAIKDGKILNIGAQNEILDAYNAKEKLDLQGKAVFPGFIDAHCHFTGYALDKWKLNLAGSRSWEEVISKVNEYAARNKEGWIYGRGWDQELWNGEMPDNAILDSLFPARPVYLRRIDGHAAIANSTALRLAGIDKDMEIEGGAIEQKNGKLTGLILDNAQELIESKVPEVAREKALKYFEDAQNECLALGLTGVHDCGISARTLDLLKEMSAGNNLKLHVYAFLSDKPEHYEQYLKSGRQKWGNVTFGGYKIYADGALGSRGASLIEAYHDKPGWHGLVLKNKMELDSIAAAVINSNLQICTHAIGDSANRIVLDIYSKYLTPTNDKRWRIEHAQVVHPNDFERFGKHKIIPSVQPTHATSDMGWAHQRLGNKRVKYAYAYNDLLKSAGWIILGTDFPVEDINPLWTYYAATNRQNKGFSPKNGWQMENKLSREDAIRGMTIWAAKGAFMEKTKGSLEIGKDADFIIFNKDINTITYRKIMECKVNATYIKGKKVFEDN